ncbi:MAG TPA: Hsp20/alpha crystallin family protein [Opitutae bacterium]|mgnify:CR=1 FL=1|nr:Hsp20/alpha crystallin family protein [Opitutae bacterium]
MNSTELETVNKQEHSTEGVAKARNWRRPRYDVAENDDAFSVRVTLPGVNREGVDLSIEDETLTIVGTRSSQLPDGWRPLRRELPTGDYRLSLRLNVAIDEAKVSAKVADGILELTLPKADEVKPRKIQVS